MNRFLLIIVFLFSIPARAQYPVPAPKGCGYIDSTGKFLRMSKLTGTAFSEGKAALKADTKWFVIDEQFKVCIPYGYDSIGLFVNNLCPVLVGGQWSYIGTDGMVRIKGRFTSIDNFYRGYARVCTDQGCFIIDTTGTALTSPYAEISRLEDTLFAARPKDQEFWMLFTTNGDTLLNDSFTRMSAPSGGIVCVERKGACRFLDLKGKNVFGRSYMEAMPFGTYYACIREGDDWFLIDRSGNQVKNIRLKTPVVLDEPLRPCINYNGSWGYLSRNGSWVYLLD